METLIYFIIAAIFCLFFFLKFIQPKKKHVIGYVQKESILSPAERSFYGVMHKALGDSYIIFSKVRIADVLKPESGLNRSEWQIAFNRISSKHFDFVLCNPKTLKIEHVVELNDKSHNNVNRLQRDSFINEACASAGMNLIFIKAKKSYSLEDIRSKIHASI